MVLEGTNDIFIEQSLKFKFKDCNNLAEYETLIAGMTFTLEMDATNLQVKSDSKLAEKQVSEEYQKKESQLIRYLINLHDLFECFKTFEIEHVRR